MWIYKITNVINNKIYIGQSIRPVQYRFKRHINDAMHNIINTHFARAIREYGPENFIIEEIDTASTQDELNQKEQYWIKYYNSVIEGYNETDAINKCGGNTYQSKTKEEMDVIKEKIRISKMGKKNPMARQIKRINHNTGEEEYYDSIIECARACGIKGGKTSITRRLSGQVTSLYKGVYSFEYCNE